MFRLRFWGLTALACAVTGCSSGSKGSTSTAATGGTTGRSTTSSGSTTSGGSTSSSGGSTTTSGNAFSGVITLSQLPSAGGGVEGSAPLSTASVVFATGGPATPSCAGTQSGNCCLQPAGASSGNVTPGSVSAGTIAFTDNGTGIGHVAYGSQAYPPLTSATSRSFTWAAGDTIGVRNGGAAVDQFTGSVNAPQPIASLYPNFSTASPTTVPLGQDLVVTWASSGDMQLTFSITDPNAGGISCTANDSDGTLTVPTALLSQLISGDPGTVVITRQNLSVPPLSTDNATVVFQIAITALGSVSFE